MIISIPDSVTEMELNDAVTNSIAESLGVHPSDIEVTVDMITGEVEFYNCRGRFLMKRLVFNSISKMDKIKNEIISAIEDAIPSVEVEEYNVSDDVTAMVR
eukprot:UN19167